MWDAWDNAVDNCLSQLPEMLNNPSYYYKVNIFLFTL